MQQSSSADKAWYALRNTVYALGCRVALSLESGPAGYAESRSQSWRYFENALAVATDLMYGRAEVTSVRALILMVLPRPTTQLLAIQVLAPFTLRTLTNVGRHSMLRPWAVQLSSICLCPTRPDWRSLWVCTLERLNQTSCHPKRPYHGSGCGGFCTHTRSTLHSDLVGHR